MSWRHQFHLPDGVEPDDPEAAELLAKIKALKPLPPKLTVREQLAETLYGAYHASAVNPHDITLAGADSETQSDVLAQADAAIVFFRQVMRDTQSRLKTGGLTNIGVMHDDNIEDFIEELEGDLSK